MSPHGLPRLWCDLRVCFAAEMLIVEQNNNFTFDPDTGGFSEDNLLCIDRRGFKTIVQAEAAEFLQPQQLLLNSTVNLIEYSGDGVQVTLANNETLRADYALVTFSVGVLQNDDVTFSPALPDWKQEAVQAITMVSTIAFSRSTWRLDPYRVLGYLHEDLLAVLGALLV